MRSLSILIISIILSVTLPRQGNATEMVFGNILHNGGLIDKHITSMKDMHFTNMVRQHTDFSCGAAAVATILKYAYGLDVTEDQIIRGMLLVSDIKVVSARGFSMLDMKHYVQTIDLQGRGYQIKYPMLLRLKIPVIVLLDMKGYKHFVVLAKATPDSVYIADPALGNRLISRNEFKKEWNNIIFAVVGPGLDHSSSLLSPPPPLTASISYSAMRPLNDSQLLEFGFDYRTFF
ncbi:MAG TPA: C39 family peptidase [Burkholderiales bacterium]|nr:C39 family peptidase [Burkholderiales bacterium]